MKSLYTYINESILDVEDNINKSDDLESFVINWINEHNIATEGELSVNRTKQNIDNIKITKKGVDIITPAGYKEKIRLKLVGEESIPFKINKLDGFINIRETKKFDGENLPNECCGIGFEYVSKLNWKNAVIKLAKKTSNRIGWGVSFWRSPAALKSINNVTFDFTGTDSNFDIDNLKSGMFNGVKFKSLGKIFVNNKISMTDEELSKIEGAKFIIHEGNTFDVKKGAWK